MDRVWKVVELLRIHARAHCTLNPPPHSGTPVTHAPARAALLPKCCSSHSPYVPVSRPYPNPPTYIKVSSVLSLVHRSSPPPPPSCQPLFVGPISHFARGIACTTRRKPVVGSDARVLVLFLLPPILHLEVALLRVWERVWERFTWRRSLRIF
jgi:hypothetical protein